MIRKAIFAISAAVMVALTGCLIALFVARGRLPYNSEGRYFDAAQAVDYKESAVPTYGALSLLSAAVAIRFVWGTIRAWRK